MVCSGIRHGVTIHDVVDKMGNIDLQSHATWVRVTAIKSQRDREGHFNLPDMPMEMHLIKKVQVDG